MKKVLFLLIVLTLVLAACAPGFSRRSLGQVEPHLPFVVLLQDPDAYKGKVVMYGGEIIQTRAEANEAWVEVLQKPLDWQHRPQPGDVSSGRFLAHFSSFQDPVIYAPGRPITVIGEVRGKIVQKIGDLDYSYPLIEAREPKLWRPEGRSNPSFHFGIGIGGMIR
jgi:outer membrane lipoprotein